MAHHVRAAIAGSVVLTILVTASGCNATTTPSPTPTVVVSTATPTPSPTPTYGPNATAALLTVTKYYDWINTYSKDPAFPNFGELNRLAKEDALSVGAASVNSLRFEGRHQVGDITVASLVPDSDSPSLIRVTACVDASNASVVDSQGQLVPRPSTLPVRLAFSLKLRNDAGAWFVVSDQGGMTAC